MMGDVVAVGNGSLAGVLFLIACWVGLLVVFARLWLTRDRIDDSELGPVVFYAEVDVKFRRGPDDPYSFVSRTFGWPRLRVHEDTIAIRAPGVANWLGSTMMMNYTLRATDCEMGVARIWRWHPLVPGSDEYVMLRTTDKRGWLEIGLRPKTVSVERLQEELIRAGARPAVERVPSLSSG